MVDLDPQVISYSRNLLGMKEPPIVANQPLSEVLIAKKRSKHHPCTSMMGQYTLDTIPKMIHGTGIFTCI